MSRMALLPAAAYRTRSDDPGGLVESHEEGSVIASSALTVLRTASR